MPWVDARGDGRGQQSAHTWISRRAISRGRGREDEQSYGLVVT